MGYAYVFWYWGGKIIFLGYGAYMELEKVVINLQTIRKTPLIIKSPRRLNLVNMVELKIELTSETYSAR